MNAKDVGMVTREEKAAFLMRVMPPYAEHPGF